MNLRCELIFFRFPQLDFLGLQICVFAFTFISLALTHLKSPRTGSEPGTIWMCKCAFALLPSFRFRYRAPKRPVPDSNRSPCPFKKEAGISGGGGAGVPMSPLDPQVMVLAQIGALARPSAWPERLAIWVTAAVSYSS